MISPYNAVPIDELPRMIKERKEWEQQESLKKIAREELLKELEDTKIAEALNIKR